MAEVGTKWGEDENHILVNGAFRQTETTLGSKLVFTKNDKYYDKDHVYIDTLVQKFIDGTAGPDTNRKRYEAGEVDSFTVSAKDKEGWKTYVTGEDGTGTQKDPANPNCNGILSSGGSTYIGYYNFIRQNWKYNDNSLRKTDEERVATAQALRNKNFRKGFLYGLDVLNYLSQYKPGSESEWLYRSYTNRELTYATDTDGKSKDYGEYVDAVYNREQGTTGVSLSGIKNAETAGNSDPVFDASKATKYFSDAKKALIDSGTLKESDFPIKVDVIADMEATTRAYEEEMYTKLENASGGVVDIQLNVPASNDENIDWGSISNNYDFSMWSGWGPDYADPQTFLHTMIVGGDMVEQLGF
jgi:ABC-type oligopeptide transport system substrate-binding subunit